MSRAGRFVIRAEETRGEGMYYCTFIRDGGRVWKWTKLQSLADSYALLSSAREDAKCHGGRVVRLRAATAAGEE